MACLRDTPLSSPCSTGLCWSKYSLPLRFMSWEVEHTDIYIIVFLSRLDYTSFSFFFLPMRGSNLQGESSICVFSPASSLLRLPQSPLPVPDRQRQLGGQRLPAGRTKPPDGGSVNAAPSASAQCSRAAALWCSCKKQGGFLFLLWSLSGWVSCLLFHKHFHKL